VRFISRLSLLVLATAAFLILSAPARASVSIAFCQTDCLCITWVTGASAVIEVRCQDGSGGWTTSPTLPPDGSGGTWDGSGIQQSPPSSLPGTILNSITSAKVSAAKTKAQARLRGERVDKGQWAPTECTDLFANSPLGLTGAQMFAYMEFRDGTGVKDAKNVDVCASGTVSAWTTCCTHDPVVFICPLKFNPLSAELQTIKLIHEALHVAGEPEDTDGTVGPGDPPNRSQIDDLVTKACPPN
jgi:hypothetical protein